MGGRGSSPGAKGGARARENDLQYKDAQFYAQTRGATAVRYTNPDGTVRQSVLENGKWVDKTITQTGGIYNAQFSVDVENYAKMKPEALQAELKKQQAISTDAYVISTRSAASRTGSQVSKFASADVKIRQIKQVLRRK